MKMPLILPERGWIVELSAINASKNGRMINGIVKNNVVGNRYAKKKQIIKIKPKNEAEAVLIKKFCR